MNVRLASDAYLQSSTFPEQYDRVLDELQAVAFLVPTLGDDVASAASINEKRMLLRDSWPDVDEPELPATDSPRDEVMLWLDMILHRVTAMLSSALTAVMR
jgi:hypothetical protein